MIRHPRKFVEEKLTSLVRIKYNRFQWWRNWKIKDTLHPYRGVDEKIQNGDFDHSPYYWMAQYALYELDDKLVGVKDPEQQREATSLYMEKYRRLMEDYHKDEAQRMENLKRDLVKQTRATRDQVDKIIETFEGTLEDLWQYVNKLYGTVRQSPPGFRKFDSLTFEDEREPQALIERARIS